MNQISGAASTNSSMDAPSTNIALGHQRRCYAEDVFLGASASCKAGTDSNNVSPWLGGPKYRRHVIVCKGNSVDLAKFV